jgi:hypothetical protein
MRAKVPAVPYPEGRNANRDGDEACELCRDDGVVMVGYSATGTDETAPCPRCQLGFEAEFGYLRIWETRGKNERLVIWHDPFHAPWGPKGYWHRHSNMADTLVPTPDSEPLPLEENRRRWIAMQRVLMAGAATDQLLDDIFRNDPEGRQKADATMAAHRRMASVSARSPSQPHPVASPMTDPSLPQIIRETSPERLNILESEVTGGVDF